MSQYLQNYDFKNSVLVPIPMYWKKKNRRGFNQAEVMCKSISEKTGIPRCNLIKRIRDTKTQVGLSKESRINNVRDAFIIDHVRFSEISSKTIILIDDVFTTGSTLEQCARVLKENGVSKVFGFTFAKSRIPDSV
jgi:ComF family protein